MFPGENDSFLPRAANVKSLPLHPPPYGRCCAVITKHAPFYLVAVATFDEPEVYSMNKTTITALQSIAFALGIDPLACRYIFILPTAHSPFSPRSTKRPSINSMASRLARIEVSPLTVSTIPLGK